MRTLVHLSDLHFGCVNPRLLDPLLASVRRIAPDVVTVSGDLTQRARTAEFQAARAFLDQLPRPQVVVPGNHDVPLYNVVRRFLAPLSRYRRFISQDLEPSYVDEEIAVIGINTARSLTFKNGRINHAQIDYLNARLRRLPASTVKVVVTHHPFDLPGARDGQALVGRSAKALNTLAACGVDLLLSGHTHESSAASTDHPALAGYKALMVQAGTSTSTRGRGEANAFNVLRLEASRITVERHAWRADAGAFQCADSEVFQNSGGGWSKA